MKPDQEPDPVLVPLADNSFMLMDPKELDAFWRGQAIVMKVAVLVTLFGILIAWLFFWG
jgi:hypothetical protein